MAIERPASAPAARPAARGFLRDFALVHIANALVAFLFRPLSELRPNQPAAYGVGLTEAFFTKLKVSFVAGLFVASPVVFFQAWRFVAPGLYATEKRMALPFATAASMFFTLGAAFCYRLVFPTAFRFFLDGTCHRPARRRLGAC